MSPFWEFPRVLQERWLKRRGNLPYVNARIAARRGRLLPAETWPRLLALDANQIARFLGEGTYAAEIREYGLELSGADLVERAVEAHLARSTTEILGYCAGRLRLLVSRFLWRFDAQNLRAVLRGVQGGQAAAEIVAAVLPAGEWPLEFWRRLAGAGELAALLPLLPEAPWGRPLRAVWKKEPDLRLLEEEVERIHFAALGEVLPGGGRAAAILREACGQEIDLVNLATVFGLRREGVEPEAVVARLIAGGWALAPETLSAWAAITGQEALSAAVAAHDFGRELELPGEGFDGRVLDTAIRRYRGVIRRRISRGARRYPNSELPVIEYLLLRTQEARRLVTVVRGQALGLPRERIERMLSV